MQQNMDLKINGLKITEAVLDNENDVENYRLHKNAPKSEDVN